MVGELDGVAQQIDDDLAQPGLVADHGDGHLRPDMAGQLQPLPVRPGGEPLGRIAQAVVEVKDRGVQIELAGLDLGEVEHVVDQRQQGLARLLEGQQVLALVGGESRIEHEFGHPDDHVHGSADLVAHVGQEGAFRPTGRLGRLLGGAEGFGRALLLGDVADGGLEDPSAFQLHPGQKDRGIELASVDSLVGPFEEVGALLDGRVHHLLGLHRGWGSVRLVLRREVRGGAGGEVCLALAAEQLDGGGVPAQESFFGGHQHDGVPGGIVERPVLHFADTQRFGRPLLLRDVAGDAERADDPAFLVVQRQLGRGDPGFAPVGPGLSFFLVDQRLARLHHLLLVRPGLLHVFLGEEIGIARADGLGGVAEPETGGQGPVDPDEAALGIFEVDVVREVVHQGVQQVPFLLQGRLGLTTRGDVPKDDLDADDLAAGIADGGLHHLDVAGFVPLLVLLHALEYRARRGHLAVVLLILFGQFGRIEIEVGLAHDRRKRLAEQLAERLVGEREFAA